MGAPYYSRSLGLATQRACASPARHARRGHGGPRACASLRTGTHHLRLSPCHARMRLTRLTGTRPRPVTTGSPAPPRTAAASTSTPPRPSPSGRPPIGAFAVPSWVSRRGSSRVEAGRLDASPWPRCEHGDASRQLRPAPRVSLTLNARGRSCSRPGHAAAPLPRHTFPARAPAPPSAAPRCENFWPGRGPPRAAPHTVDSQSAEHRRRPPCHQDDVRASKTPRGTLPSMPRSARAGGSLAGTCTQLRHVPAVTNRIVARLRRALPLQSGCARSSAARRPRGF